MIEKSKIFGVNVRDILYGTIIAALGAILTALYQMLTTTPIIFDWRGILLAGLTAGISYIIKNFFSNSNGKFAKKEVEAESVLGPGGSSNPPDGGRPPKPSEQ